MKYVIIKKSRHYTGGPGMSPERYLGKPNPPDYYTTFEEAEKARDELNRIGSSIGYSIEEYFSKNKTDDSLV